MTSSATVRSGKAPRDENFPVASWLIKAQHRPAILAFYDFVRIADDVADHPRLSNGDKLDRLDRLEASLIGTGAEEPEGLKLRAVLDDRGLSPVHAQDLLRAFRQDVIKHRYADWEELIAYCTLSAMPVGRFVLDVHGESRATWPASDALCAALQVINHLQDCAADYRDLDRVYLPLDDMAARGLDVEALREPRASPALRDCLRAVASRTQALLRRSQGLAEGVRDIRLALEIATIQRLAERLAAILQVRDPLSEAAHLSTGARLATAAQGISRGLLTRLFGIGASARRYQTP